LNKFEQGILPARPALEWQHAFQHAEVSAPQSSDFAWLVAQENTVETNVQG
jgi:hypothetical protein